jgi:tetratricopeptide (TPR) repeat protein
MGTKEVMITAPFLVLLYDRMFLANSLREVLRRRWGMYAGFLAACGGLAAIMALQAGARPNESYTWEGVGPVAYFLTQCRVICHYLRLSVWPSGLCLDYHWPVEQSLFAVLPRLVFLLLLAFISVLLVARRNPAGFPAAAFFVILAPTSSFVPRPDCAFEHRMYLPLACVAVLVVAGGGKLLLRVARPRIAAAIGIAAVAALGTATHLRNNDYRTEARMWQDVVQKSPHNLRARNDLAAALSEEGRVRAAVQAYEDVLAAIPADIRSRLELGKRRVGATFTDNTPEYEFFRAHANMGLLLRRVLGNNGEALEHYLAALQVAPFHTGVRNKAKVAMAGMGIAPEDMDAELNRRLGVQAKRRNTDVPQTQPR